MQSEKKPSDILTQEKTPGSKSPCAAMRIKRSYLPFKAIYFLQNGGQAPTLYRALFMKHLGMSAGQIGLIWAVDRVFGIVAGPVAGVVSDKVKKPRLVNQLILLFASLLCAATFFIPTEECKDSTKWNCYSLSCQSFTNESSSLCSIKRNGSLEETLPIDVSLNNSCYIANKTEDDLLSNVSSVHEYEVHVADFDGLNTSNSCACWINSNYSYDEYGVTFWSLLLLVIATSAATTSSNTLIDTLILNQFSDKTRHHYGLQRVWGAIGFGVSGFLVGYLKDLFASMNWGGNTAFISFAFYPAALWIPTCFLIKCIRSSGIDKRQPLKFHQLKLIFSDIRMLFFLLLMIAYGYTIAAGEIYMFYFAEARFDAASTVLGLTVVAAEAMDVLAYIASPFLMKRFTANFLMALSVLALGARLVLYTFATAAWHLIVIELLRGGVALAWVAVCNQVAKMSPPELRATVIGVTNACSRALGYGASGLLGGIMIKAHGFDIMFYVSFAVSFFSSAMYFFFYKWNDWRETKQGMEKCSETELKRLQEDEKKHNSSALKTFRKEDEILKCKIEADANFV